MLAGPGNYEAFWGLTSTTRLSCPTIYWRSKSMAIEQQSTEQVQKASVQEQGSPPHEVLTACNATTGEVIGVLPVADEAEVRTAVRQARAAQAGWARLSFKERGSYLVSLRNLILKRADEIAELISREVGKPRIEALMTEIMAAAGLINYYVANTEKMLAHEPNSLYLFKALR